jgi:hypothetical protein
MLDKLSVSLLNIINESCDGASYKVLEIEWLCERLYKEFRADNKAVQESLRVLLARELISVKYQDEAEVCLRPLPKGRTETEYRQDRQTELVKTKKTVCLYAVLGGAVGGVITAVLTAIIMRLFGVS